MSALQRLGGWLSLPSFGGSVAATNNEDEEMSDAIEVVDRVQHEVQNPEALETQIVPHIYRELDDLFLRVGGNYTKHLWANPFWKSDEWTEAQLLRYRVAAEHTSHGIGPEYLAVVMHSAFFRKVLWYAPPVFILPVLSQVRQHRESLRMFAIIRHIPYLSHYKTLERRGFLAIDGHPWAQNPPKPLPHHHEVFLPIDQKEKIRKLTIDNQNIIDIGENIYAQEPFLEHQRKLGKPASWPRGWPYPWDPQWVGLKPRNVFFWPDCSHCGCYIVQDEVRAAKEPAENLCSCSMKDVLGTPRPLFEVVQLPPLPGDPMGINRGVCALSDIKKGAILAEYTGSLLPPLDEDSDYYSFAWLHPWKTINEWRQGGPNLQNDQKIAEVSAALRGSWTRFVNQGGSIGQKDGPHNNCEFHQRCIAGKTRVIIQAKRDIAFGEELTAWYGDAYWKDEKFQVLGMKPGQSRKRKRKLF